MNAPALLRLALDRREAVALRDRLQPGMARDKVFGAVSAIDAAIRSMLTGATPATRADVCYLLTMLLGSALAIDLTREQTDEVIFRGL